MTDERPIILRRPGKTAPIMITHGGRTQSISQWAREKRLARIREMPCITDNPEENVKMQYRQGDILIERVDAIPPGAQEQKTPDGRVVLAYGEATGHAHAFYGKGVRYFAPNDQGVAHIEVTGKRPALLRHEEHAAIPVPPGKYRVVRQREYQAPDLNRQVAD